MGSINFNKALIHRIYLLCAAIVVTIGVIIGLTSDGYFNWSSLRYFTYLSNILVIFGLIFLFIFYNKKPVAHNYICGSIVLAISVTGLIYNFVLVPFANNDFIFTSYSNFSNHLLSMILVLLNYFIFEKKGCLTAKHVIVGMLFPLLYWLVFIVSGSWTNFYPYFFMNIKELGIMMALVWLMSLLAIFAVLGTTLVIYDRGIGNKENLIVKMYCRTVQFILRIASPILPWRTPRILNGENSVLDLSKLLYELGLIKPFIVTDNILLEIGLLNPMLESFKVSNINYIVYKEVQPNPTIDNVESALVLYKAHKCDCIIAFGGGSPIDCAKALGARIVKPNKRVIKMAGLFKILKRLPPLIAVPTTSGTGSETTIAAVITDTKTHLKFAINDLSLIPHYAVLDPILTLKLPKFLTATTGMDALTHAIEAYIGHSNTKKTRIDAKNACHLIKENLLQSVEHGDDKVARNNVMMASHYAGRAFTRAYVGNIHAAAHTLSGFYNVPHGLANAILLPHVLQYYGKVIYKKLGELADVMEILGANDQEKSENLIDYLKELNKKMGIPDKFTCIREEDLPKMIANALKEANPLYPVPVIFSKHDFKNIFDSVR